MLLWGAIDVVGRLDFLTSTLTGTLQGWPGLQVLADWGGGLLVVLGLVWLYLARPKAARMASLAALAAPAPIANVAPVANNPPRPGAQDHPSSEKDR